MKFLVLLIFLYSQVQILWACGPGKKELGGLRFSGAVRIDEKVLSNEFELRIGDCVDSEMLALAVQRIRNTNLFARADMEVNDGSQGLDVFVSIVERWTILPIMKFGGGGGVSFYTLGLYNPHVFGKNFELGAQYENLGGVPSGVLWFRKPRLFGKRLRIGGDLWYVTRNRLLYDDQRNESGGFTLNRKRLHLFADYEIIEYVKPYLALDYQMDDTSDSNISANSKRNNVNSGFDPRSQGSYLITRLGLFLGRLDIFEELLEGLSLDLQVEPVHDFEGQRTFLRSKLEAQYATRLSSRSNWAQRLVAASQSTESLSQLYYLGSISDFRGVLDSQFQTKEFVALNSEYRIPSIVRNYVLQHAFFVDAVAFEQSGKTRHAASIGTGVRLIIPKVYRLNLRLDWAKSLGFGAGSAVSFGLQQFF